LKVPASSIMRKWISMISVQVQPSEIRIGLLGKLGWVETKGRLHCIKLIEIKGEEYCGLREDWPLGKEGENPHHSTSL